nr:aralkylamine N-acetyltransferase (EC 2.3.1.87) - fruit fly (Drosophila melanogaster) (fragments) [Drosophila melanogaster]
YSLKTFFFKDEPLNTFLDLGECKVDQDCPYTIELIQPEDGGAV